MKNFFKLSMAEIGFIAWIPSQVHAKRLLLALAFLKHVIDCTTKFSISVLIRSRSEASS